jgi:hypothetical protein
MTSAKRRRVWMAGTVAMILCLIAVMPKAADATLLDPFLDKSVLLDVSILQDGDNWVYTYDVKNPTAILITMSVGTRDPFSLNLYTVGSWDAPSPAVYDRTSDSLILTFNPFLVPSGLPMNSRYIFSITYDDFIDDQYITFSKVGSRRITKDILAQYVPVPEPGILLLLGMGVLSSGLLYRRWSKPS